MVVDYYSQIIETPPSQLAITDLPTADLPLTGNVVIVVVQDGITKQTTLTNLFAAVGIPLTP